MIWEGYSCALLVWGVSPRCNQKVAGAGAAYGWPGICLSLCSPGLLYAVPVVARLGFLTVWHPQDSGSAHMVTQGSSWSVPLKRAEMKCDIILQLVLRWPYSSWLKASLSGARN